MTPQTIWVETKTTNVRFTHLEYSSFDNESHCLKPYGLLLTDEHLELARFYENQPVFKPDPFYDKYAFSVLVFMLDKRVEKFEKISHFHNRPIQHN